MLTRIVVFKEELAEFLVKECNLDTVSARKFLDVEHLVTSQSDSCVTVKSIAKEIPNNFIKHDYHV